MFGDTGHGLIMLLFALFLIVREKQLAAKMANSEVRAGTTPVDSDLLVKIKLILF